MESSHGMIVSQTHIHKLDSFVDYSNPLLSCTALSLSLSLKFLLIHKLINFCGLHQIITLSTALTLCGPTTVGCFE